MAAAGKIRIGTSGWHYDHWRGPFYPGDLAREAFLTYYAGRFRTVEINSSFYRLPTPETLARWRESVPDDFLFSFKAGRYITHMKKLKDSRPPVLRMLETARSLGESLGPVLFQLPPRWRFNLERFRGFLAHLPPGYRYAFELRDPTWLVPAAFDALAGAGAAFCIYELAGRSSPRLVTSEFVYMRLHGPEDTAYTGSYPEPALADWAEALSAWAAEGKDVFCYFDNDEAGHAVRDAVRLREMVHDF